MSREPALSGIRVLEQGTFITGPCAGMMLADLGADVIKIESLEGDPYRAYQGGQYSPHFQAYNRNKRSLSLDMKLKSDCALFDQLASEADVYIQNFRPGTAERLGAGVARLREVNPRLVYCSISGFGSSGPYYDRPSYDSVAQALSGFLSVVVDNRRPQFLGPALADAITGMYASQGVLAALVQRGRSGRGAHVEVSMLEAMCHFNLDDFTHYFSAGEVMGPYSRPSVSQSYVFECADAKWVALHMSSPEKFWQSLAGAIEQPKLFEDPKFADRAARIVHQEDLIALMRPIFKTRPRADWCERLRALEVPHAAVYDSTEALADPQAVHLRLQTEATHPEMGRFRTVRYPAQFDGEPIVEVAAPPTLGEHNRAGDTAPAWRARSAPTASNSSDIEIDHK